MTTTCICLATGRLHMLRESVGSFLAQDHPDKELIIVNVLSRQTLELDDPRVRIQNVKQQPVMPMRAKNWAAGEARGEVIIAWDEMSVMLPGFLSQIAEAIKGREWCYLDKEYTLERGRVMRQSPGTEFSFAFTKKAWEKAGRFGPGVYGASDRNLIGKITAMYPGEKTVIQPKAINLLRIGSIEEREIVRPLLTDGKIVIQPVLTRDYQELAAAASAGRRESRVCVVELGRYGDVINLLPILKHIHDHHSMPTLMISEEFADLLEGVSYVKPFVTQLPHSKLGQALSIAREEFQIVLNGGVWGEGHTQVKRTRCYNMESWSNLGMLHRFEEKDFRPIFDRRDPQREKELLEKIRGDDARPMILVNVTNAVSSPCPQCAALFGEIAGLWGKDYHIVDLSKFKAHRIYDFLGVFEQAACLVSIDTAWISLVAATNLSCVAIVNPKGNGWASTQVRCGNAAASITYDEVLKDRCKELQEAIAAALEIGNSGPIKLFDTAPVLP